MDVIRCNWAAKRVRDKQHGPLQTRDSPRSVHDPGWDTFAATFGDAVQGHPSERTGRLDSKARAKQATLKRHVPMARRVGRPKRQN